MRKQAERLFPDDPTQQQALLTALTSDEPLRHPAVIWTGDRPADHDLPVIEATDMPWLPAELSLLEPDASPGKSPLLAEGAIYPMDRSSLYTASAMLASGHPRRVLDVCAAPGGKSLFAATLLQPDYLLSNEVVGKRLGILRHNLSRSGRPHVFTQSLDPAELAVLAPESFDLVIVDAPCSGQSLLAKGTENLGCFHPNIIKGNAKRQLRILSQSAECVAPGGYLFYSTCTYAERENEGAIEKWLKRSETTFEPVAVPHLQPQQSDLVDWPCYRIYPHRDRGAGGFAALLRRTGDTPAELPDLPSELLGYPVKEAE